MKTLKEVFDYHFKNVRFDKRFVDNVGVFLQQFLSKNEEHVSFFGSHLIGVHPVRWNYSDTDTWWDEIFGVHDSIVQQDIAKLPAIKTNRVVSSDTLNHAFIYSLYRIHHEPSLSPQQKEATKLRIMIALNCKFICSLMAHYFKYPADRGVAEMTFNKLTKRYDLKTQGNWGNMIRARSEDFVKQGARYYKAYTEYNDDVEIVKMLNDAQGRIRETVKDITRVFYQVKEENAKMLFSSSTVDLDGTTILKDIENQSTKYVRYAKDLINTKDGYLKPELEAIIFDIIKSIDPDVFEELCHEFMNNYQNKKYAKDFNQLIEDVILYSFEILKDANIKSTDLGITIEYLKNNFMSGRSTHPVLLSARKHFIKVVECWDKTKKNSPMVPERCGFFLYLFLRTILMSRYK